MTRRLLATLIFILALSGIAAAQSNPPLRITEIDGSPSKVNATRLNFPNGTLTATGNTVTYTPASGVGLGTVTNTAGNLTANSVVLGAGGADTKVNAGLVTTGSTTTLDLTVGRDVIATRQLKGQFVTLTPLSDVISAVIRRNGASQTSNLVEFQTELNALLSGVDKTGAIFAPKFGVNGSNLNTVPTVNGDVFTLNAATQTLTNKTLSGSNNTFSNLPAAGILGVIPIANLATGTPDGTKFIRDDGVLAVPAGGGGGSGDVVGPASATNNAIVRFDSTTGKLVQDSAVTIDDTTGAIVGLKDKGGQVFNVKAYGATGDGTTDDSTAVLAAIAAAITAHGTVYLPAGTYVMSTQINVDDVTGLVIEGASGAVWPSPATARGGSAIRWKGTGTTPAITANGSNGLVFRDLAVYYDSASFTGNLVEFGAGLFGRPSSFNIVERCHFGSWQTTLESAKSLLNLNGAVGTIVQKSAFSGAKWAIRGFDGGAISNAVYILNSVLYSCSEGFIGNIGIQWVIDGCTFQFDDLGAGAGAPPVGIGSDITCTSRFTVSNSAFWDADGTVQNPIKQELANTWDQAVIEKNYFDNFANTNILLNGPGRVTITDNFFGTTVPEGVAQLIDLGSSVSAPKNSVLITGNKWTINSTQNAVINTSGHGNVEIFGNSGGAPEQFRLGGPLALTTPTGGHKVILGVDPAGSGTINIQLPNALPGFFTPDFLLLDTGGLMSTSHAAANVLTFLGTPSSANMLAAVTDETGSGLAVFNNTPTVITPSFTTGFTIGGAAASRKMIVGNGTNFVASTETWAVPGTSGNVLTSDGTNWTSAAPSGGGLTVGTTTITGGTDTKSLYNNAGVVGERTVTGTGNAVLSASPTLTGTVGLAALTASGTIVQTSASATAFESGPNGSTNPVFRLVNNVASAATGLSVTGNAAAGGVTLSALSSGSDENIKLLPKGAGATLVTQSSFNNGSAIFKVIAGDGNAAFTFTDSGLSLGQFVTSIIGPNASWIKTATVLDMQASSSIHWSNGSNYFDTLDIGLARNGAGLLEVNNGAAGTFRDLKVRQYFTDQTITAGGTTGNQTINKAAGTVNIAAAGTSVTVTSSLCTTSSQIFAVIRTNDSTATIKNVVPGSGSFVITLAAAATAEVSIGWWILNQ